MTSTGHAMAQDVSNITFPFFGSARLSSRAATAVQIVAACFSAGQEGICFWGYVLLSYF